jgi:uncharacterized protein YndB with AHSA1/START domain
MEYRIALATTAEGSRRKVFDVLRTTEGQKAFWTTDCELTDVDGRFSFLQSPVDLEVTVSLVEEELVSMTVTAGFPGWSGSTWQWRLSPVPGDDNVTIVQFRHFGFESGHEEDAVGFTAQTWAMILDRLARYIKSGEPDPFFTNEPT